MIRRLWPVRWISPCVAIALFLMGCAGAFSERETPGEDTDIGDREFVAALKERIDYLVTCEDAMEDIGAVRGKIVKWNGTIVRIWSDKIQIQSRGREEPWNNFFVLLDHPLPKETIIGERTQIISERDEIYVLGRILDRQTVILKSGTHITAPHLEGYAISKDNDRNFAHPAWVGHRM